MSRLTCALAFLAPVLALAAPGAGDSFPALLAKNVEGNPERVNELLGKAPTLVVAITERGGSDQMKAWFEGADSRGLSNDRRISILSLDLSFVVTDDYARSKAREEIPEQFWKRSLMDKNGSMAKQLRLEKSTTPWVWVVAANGKVLAAVHGTVDQPGATAIWKALGLSQGAPKVEKKKAP